MSGLNPPKIDGELKRAVDEARHATEEFLKSMSRVDRLLAHRRNDDMRRFGDVDADGEVTWAKDSEAQTMKRWHENMEQLVPDQVIRLLKRWQKRAPFPTEDKK